MFLSMNKSDTPSDRNQAPIFEILKEVVTEGDRNIFEIGSGSAQHAIYMAPKLPGVTWITSDITENHKMIKASLEAAKIPNIRGPFQFEVGKDDFPRIPFDIVFTANTLHIMSWKNCKTLMKNLGNRLREGSQVVIYGPFNYDGKFTSESNEKFDQWLKERNPESGIRAFEDINNNMTKNGFTLYKDFEMPANNRTLVFTRLNFVK